jgi:hypothetical protein
MPVIVYQSLNSNSSNDHDASAINIQYYTRMAQKHSVQQGSENWSRPGYGCSCFSTSYTRPRM